jgi:hypothetical protein
MTVPNQTSLEFQRYPLSTADPAHLRLPGSALARFLELRGRRTIRACGAVWYSIPDGFLMSLPYQAMLNPDPGELRRLIRENHVLGVRFPSTKWTGLESGLYVIRHCQYDIESVHAKHRPRVRKGMETFDIRLATASELMAQGRTLNLSTMARQGRYDPEFGEKRRWQILVEAAFACSEVSFPAAFAGKRLAAYMVTCREQGWLHILHQMSRQEDLPNFPNHVLTYAVTRQAVIDDSLDAVSYGYVPLFAADGLHEYKLRFGYEMIPHQSVIQLHPTFGPALDNPVVRLTLRCMRTIKPGDQRLETIDTVLKGARSSQPLARAC